MFLAEVSLQHSAIWMAGVYLMLIMQLLENKVAIELTRSEFVEAQEVRTRKVYLSVSVHFFNCDPSLTLHLCLVDLVFAFSLWCSEVFVIFSTHF